MNINELPGCRIVAQLPSDYDYRFVNKDGQMAILGVNPHKEPIFFLLEKDKVVRVILEHSFLPSGKEPVEAITEPA